MATDTSEVLDLSKENIQPLRQGRKASQLKTALQAQVDPGTQQMLQKKREEYEHKIRMYEGDDPLEPYYNYVIWLEQSFPKMGRENNVVQLLEDVLIKFKDIEKYKQDSRLMQLIIKYLSIQSNPLELYKLVYDQGLGTMCASLYKAWAEEFEKINDIKGADEIFQLGIRCRAQPLNELENAHVQFQLSVARRMLDGTLSPVSSAESSRTALSRLKSSTVKTNRISHNSAGVLPAKRTEKPLGNSNTQKFQIYEEDETDKMLKRDSEKVQKFPRGSVNNRENIMHAGKWCTQKQKQSFKLSRTPSAPSFYGNCRAKEESIHEDPEAACSNMKTDYRPRALKLRKDDFDPPIAVFEPPDPTKKPMYPKQLVYLGGRDVQLEEIRAGHYWKNLDRNSNEANHQDSNPDSFNLAQKVSHAPMKPTETVHLKDLSASQCKSDNFMPSFHHNLSTSMTVNTQAAVRIIQQMWASPLSQESEKVDNCSSLLSKKPTFPGYFDQSNVSRIENTFLVSDNGSKPKLTSQFQVYMDDPLTSVDKQNVPLPLPKIQSRHDFPRTSTFDVFCDEISPNSKDPSRLSFKTIDNMTENLSPYLEDLNCRPLDDPMSALLPKTNEGSCSVFCCETNSINRKVPSNSENCFVNIFDENKEPIDSIDFIQANSGKEDLSINTVNTPLPLIIPVNLQDTPLEPEDKENQPPNDYVSPSERRPLSGILTPATNVPVEELRSDDSDFDDGRNGMCARYLDLDRDTCTTEAFAIPLPTSTPFSKLDKLPARIHDSSSYALDEKVFPPPNHANTIKHRAVDFQQLVENSRKLSLNAPNLSLILENSKEVGGSSLGSNGK